MRAELLAYSHVPPGFEVLINDPDTEAGRVWNLWFNTKLTDDPEAWDGEIRLTNELQGRLGELTVDERLVRAQMAELCRVNPLFPRSIDILCEQIGAERFSNCASMGCEGRGLLKVLGYRTPESRNEDRRNALAGYVRSIDRWLEEDSQEGSLDHKVFGFLGQPSDHKKGLARRLLAAIAPVNASLSSLKKLCEGLCADIQPESILEGAGRPFNCFRCDACSEGESGPVCQCCCGMLVDAGLLCVGALDKDRAPFEEYGFFIQENVLAYCLAINSWLLGVPSEPVTALTATRYISDDSARRLAARVQASLGERDEVKEWLAACLLKTVKDNQRWHKKAELMDGFPQASSWFRERKCG